MSYNVYHHDWWKCLLTPEHKIADVFVLCQFSWIPIYNTENHLPTKFWSERHQIWLFPVEQEVLLKVLQVFQVFQYQESECNPGFASAPVQWKFSQTSAASLFLHPIWLKINGRSKRASDLFLFGQSSGFRKGGTFIQTWFIVISSICYCARACKQFPKTINWGGTSFHFFLLVVLVVSFCR